MKNKEWLKDEVKKLLAIGVNSRKTINNLIDQLEEPNETELSEPSAWKTIAKLYHPNEFYWGNVRDSYLESLDETEKVVVNEVMTGHIENRKNLKLTLSDSLNLVMLRNKQEEALFARAWLDGYSVDKEKLYIVKLPMSKENDMGFAILDAHGNVWVDAYPSRYELTEQEIKNIDERYCAFAEEITK